MRLLLAPALQVGCYSAPEMATDTDGAAESTETGATTGATTETSRSTTLGESSSDGTAPSESSESSESSGAADSSSGETTSESTGGPTSCFETNEAFGEPTPLTEVNSDADETGVALSPDEITIYVSSNRPEGELDLYVAVRDAIDTPFGVLTPITSVNTASGEGRPTLTADGLTLYTSQGLIAVTGDLDILVATRASLVTEFSALAPVAFINSVTNDGHPSISPDGETLYFASQALGEAGSWAIVRSEMQPNDTFSVPAVIGELETAASETSPVISADGLTLYFASDAADSEDIMVATRSSVADGFGRPVLLDEVSSTVDDRPSWVSADGCRLYLRSSRDGSNDIFVAERTP